MKLHAQQSQWDQLGRTDPLWAILTDPNCRQGRWDPAAFFETGEKYMEALMGLAGSLGLPARRETALDFGCGVGRLTQAAAAYFDQVTGVDIAPAMLELARQYNRHGERCRYLLNEQNHLRQFAGGSFDFVYSCLTLQHLPRRHIRAYLGEFVRVVRPGGLVLFQLPSEHRYRSLRHFLLHNIYSTVARKILRRPDAMDMYGIPRPKAEQLLRERGGRVVLAMEDGSLGEEWVGYLYGVTKTGPEPITVKSKS